MPPCQVIPFPVRPEDVIERVNRRCDAILERAPQQGVLPQTTTSAVTIDDHRDPDDRKAVVLRQARATLDGAGVLLDASRTRLQAAEARYGSKSTGVATPIFDELTMGRLACRAAAERLKKPLYPAGDS
jgi:hypothetical protein